MADKSIRINATISTALKKRIDKIANKERRSFSAMVNLMLETATNQKELKEKLTNG